MDNGEIYKLELDGSVVGKFGQAGKLMKQFGTVNEIDCRHAERAVRGRSPELASAEAHSALKAQKTAESLAPVR